MAAVADLVHETSTSTGTGVISLTHVNGRQPFSTAFGTGSTTDVFYYYISNRDAAEYEWGTGHMSATATLVRDTVLGGTNGTSPVSFSAGTKDVTCDVPADAAARRGVLDLYTRSVRVTTSDSVTVAADDDVVVINRASDGAVSVALPSVVDAAGREKHIFRWDANAGDLTLTPDGSETIMGLATWLVVHNADNKASPMVIPVTALSGWLVR